MVGYYTSSEGKMLSMPFNSSTPVLYYNKDAFKKADLDPEQPPTTWPQGAEVAKKTQAAGYPCGFSTAWQSWVHLENFSAWHNLPFGTKANGFEGFDAELTFNGTAQVAHIQHLADWQKDGIFKYGGRRGDSQALFTEGQCVMYTQSSAGYGGMKKTAGFDFGIGMLPYWPDIVAKPQNSIIGGATLWTFAGHAQADLSFPFLDFSLY